MSTTDKKYSFGAVPQSVVTSLSTALANTSSECSKGLSAILSSVTVVDASNTKSKSAPVAAGAALTAAVKDLERRANSLAAQLNKTSQTIQNITKLIGALNQLSARGSS